jgi:DNA-3-methyladenine glycosylase
MHYCCNIVVGKKGYGAAVLIRALEPLSGQKEMVMRRQNKERIELTNGPAKLCQALAIDKTMNGHDLRSVPLKLIIKPPTPTKDIIKTTRIGISEAKDVLWRFYTQDNPYVSKK